MGCPLLRQDVLKQATGIERTDPKHLATAAGENLPIVDQVSITVKLYWGFHERRHNFLVATSLITPAILHGDGFSPKAQDIVLDFSTMPVTVTHAGAGQSACMHMYLQYFT